MGTNLWIALWLLHALVADLIVIEPEGADPALTRVIVDSYRDAVGNIDARDDGSQARWYARVTWDESKLHARIEIRSGTPDAPIDSTREVSFSETDDMQQRHRAVGLIIAAHVLASAHAREDGRARPATAPVPTPKQTAASAGDADADAALDESSADADQTADEMAPPRMPVLGADLALLAGPALDRGAPRFGVLLRGFARPFPVPVAAVVSIGAARRFQSPELMLWSASAGLALRLQPHASAFAIELRGEALVQRTEVQAESTATDQRESGGAWRGGAQLGLEGHASVSHRVSFFAGAQLRALLPAVHIAVEGRDVGAEPALGWDALAGVRYAR